MNYRDVIPLSPFRNGVFCQQTFVLPTGSCLCSYDASPECDLSNCDREMRMMNFWESIRQPYGLGQPEPVWFPRYSEYARRLGIKEQVSIFSNLPKKIIALCNFMSNSWILVTERHCNVRRCESTDWDYHRVKRIPIKHDIFQVQSSRKAGCKPKLHISGDSERASRRKYAFSTRHIHHIVFHLGDQGRISHFEGKRCANGQRKFLSCPIAQLDFAIRRWHHGRQ